MSVLPLGTDIVGRTGCVRKVPNANSFTISLFSHLVGKKQSRYCYADRWRDFKPLDPVVIIGLKLVDAAR
jgi:hypothetical protein